MVGPRALIATALAACALASALLAPTPAHPLTTSPTSVTDSFEENDCPIAIPAEHARRVSCGVLVVPERRTPPSDPAKTISLPVIVITSKSPNASDPLVFPTAGGPGGGTRSALLYVLDHGGWANDDRDVILIEQRGNALAQPSLDCPELDVENMVDDGALLTDGEQRARRSEQIEACRARLAEEAVDLAAYTSAESVADLADLRAALRYDQWNLYGTSYGARLALTAMRDRPDGLRSVILDGVYPPHINRYEETPAGFTAALDALFADCAADSACDQQYPDLERSLADVLDRAAQDPFTVTVKHPADRSPLTVRISDTELVAGLADALQDAGLVRVLPYLIDRLAAGDVEAAVPLAQRGIDTADAPSEGLELSVDCAEEAPFNDDERIAAALAADPLLAHYGLSGGFREDCAIWGVPPLAETENAPVVSSIPTLLMTGRHDPVTPARFADVTAEHLSSSYVHTFPALGHTVLWTSSPDDCPATMARAFLSDPTSAPDASCIDGMPPTDFLTGDDIQSTSAMYRLDGDLVRDRSPLQVAIAVSILLTLFATLVYAAAYGLGWLGRRRGEAPGGLVLVAAASAVLNLLYAGGLVFVLLNTDPLILAFGLPNGIWPLQFVPFVAVATTTLLVVSLVRAWMQAEGTLFHRVALSVSAAASAMFSLWLLARGLLML